MIVALCNISNESHRRFPMEDKSHNFGQDLCLDMEYGIWNKSGHIDLCDKNTNWTLNEGWYRILPPAGVRLQNRNSDPKATYTPPGDDWRAPCSASNPGYLDNFHPYLMPGEVKESQVCFPNNGYLCEEKVPIAIKHCGPYYLYYLKPLPGCSYRYCTE